MMHVSWAHFVSDFVCCLCEYVTLPLPFRMKEDVIEPVVSILPTMESRADAAVLASCAASYAVSPQQLLTCLAMLLVDFASPLSR